jgi:GDPmannose 4,6-dehydratase
VAYNALPATFSPDMWAHQYDQQVNQVQCTVNPDHLWTTNGPESNLYGLEPNFGCCTSNLHQGWPKFCAHLWMRAPGEGIAAIAYAPGTARFQAHGVPVSVTLDTDYPFRESMKLTLKTDRPVKFPLLLRVPAWTDGASLSRILREVQPDEIYNLAAQSHVAVSFEEPEYTANSDALGTLRILEAIRYVDPKIRYYQASSSEMFGKVLEVPQRENTPFYPRSPYGVAKVYGHFITVNYRESFNMFAVSGILFNHESPRRGLEFVTRKITDGAVRIKLGMAKEVRLGNLESRRDWGFAGDYVDAMWRMLQQDQPDNFVIGTGATHSVQEFCEIAFGRVDLDYKKHVIVDERYYRPAEVDLLISDPSKAGKVLGWEPQVEFKQLVEMMVDSDLKRLKAKAA